LHVTFVKWKLHKVHIHQNKQLNFADLICQQVRSNELTFWSFGEITKLKNLKQLLFKIIDKKIFRSFNKLKINDPFSAVPLKKTSFIMAKVP